jgi:hypothetical protein
MRDEEKEKKISEEAALLLYQRATKETPWLTQWMIKHTPIHVTSHEPSTNQTKKKRNQKP